MNDYINRRQLYSDLCALLMEARNKFGDAEISEAVRREVSDETVMEYAAVQADVINEEMRAYLNAPVYSIPGNFEHLSDVNAMARRLNAGDQSVQAQKDRNFLLQWFYEAIGTHGSFINSRIL